MQMKHLIIFALVGMVALLGFNLINGNQREKNREIITASSSSEPSQEGADTDTDTPNIPVTSTSTSTDIASKPLGQQPKAILDDATAKIEQAQQTDQQRLEQMDRAQ